MTNVGKRIGLALAVGLAGLTSGVAAQEVGSDELDLTLPDLTAPQDEGGTCPDREPRPEWADNLEGYEVQRSLLLSEIYQARSYERIVATNDCSCPIKAPPWDAAEAEYQEDYAALDLGAVSGARSDFQRLSASLRRDARRICREQGNW